MPRPAAAPARKSQDRRPASIVLLSGGLDSTVNLALAVRRTRTLLALTFDYGQRAAKRELAASRAICRALGVTHRAIRLPWLDEITKTSLVSRRLSLPKLAQEELDSERVTSGETARLVWVPNRNGLFLSIAACFAEALGASLVITGFNAEEAATFPDNSARFVRAANRALALSTLRRVRVKSYTQEMRKREIVELGISLGAPLQLVWSCYQGGARPCGRCESCARLKRALGRRTLAFPCETVTPQKKWRGRQRQERRL